MVELVQSVWHALELAMGWILSPEWLPPKDFELLRWLIVPGFGYGALLVLIGVLELIVPKDRRPWGRETALSATYLLFAGKVGFYGFVVAPLIRNAWVYVGLPSLHLDQRLPLALYMPFALLVVSFAGYWAHRLMHRVPLFWHIHKIHHSVRNLNFSSVYHIHFLEDLLAVPAHLVVVLALGTDLVAPFGIVVRTLDILAHANVRLDLGRLTYFINTPQAHRIHHSAEPRHYDTNFSNTVMVWDHMFGTFHYDPANPPKAYGVGENVPVAFVKQQLLPLVAMFRDARAGARRVLGHNTDDAASSGSRKG